MIKYLCNVCEKEVSDNSSMYILKTKDMVALRIEIFSIDKNENWTRYAHLCKDCLLKLVEFVEEEGKRDMNKLRWRVQKIGGDESSPPCKEAKLEEFLIIDQRIFKTPEEHDRKVNENFFWCKKGKNHRINEIGIARDFDDMGWFIEITSLEDLLSFCRKYGDITIGPPNEYNVIDIVLE